MSGDVFRIVLAFWITVVIVPVVLCLLKGKIWTGVIGLFVPLVAIVGAIRIARLNSPWARRRYAKKPKKLAKAKRREARLDAHWIAWRDAFFDLIAGKPHLPSLPPLGGDGRPLTPATAAPGTTVAAEPSVDAAENGDGASSGPVDGASAGPADEATDEPATETRAEK
jgi:hypothetical protein